ETVPVPTKMHNRLILMDLAITQMCFTDSAILFPNNALQQIEHQHTGMPMKDTKTNKKNQYQEYNQQNELKQKNTD
ncbi:hypothetical protein VIGAN_05065000, partial [Vigna angularis var. angularis]